MVQKWKHSKEQGAAEETENMSVNAGTDWQRIP